MVLDLDLEIARQVPTAAPRFVRSVLRIGEAVGFDSDLEAFVAEGLSLGEMHASAAEAFFALESRGAPVKGAEMLEAVRRAGEDVKALRARVLAGGR